MSVLASTRKWLGSVRGARRPSPVCRRTTRRPEIEALEDRIAPAVVSFDPGSAIWYLRDQTSPGAPDIAPFSYGLPGWIPVVGDWDGNGTATIGVVDPKTMTWYLRNSNGPGAPDIAPFQFGAPGWIPVVGDWDGNGTTTVGVVDPKTMTWYLRNSNSPGAPDIAPFQFGGPGWTPVVGDWNGQWTTTIGVVNPSTETWYLKTSNGPGAPDIAPFSYGLPGWTPVVGDWDGNGTATVGVVDQRGTWYVRNQNGPGPPSLAPFGYGASGWVPLSVTPTGHALSGAIGAAYIATANLTDAAGQSVQRLLGPPKAAAQAVSGVAGADFVPFQGGSIYWSAATGAHALYGAIGAEYAALVHETNTNGVPAQRVLGLPTGDEQDVPGAKGARFVTFQGGEIDWSAATGAHVVYGAIETEYASQGGPAGSLGLPVGDEHAWAGGRLVQFQDGSISWSAATGAIVLGPTYQAVDANGKRVTYVLQGGVVDEATGNTLQPVAGPAYVSQVVVDGLNRLFALDANGVLWQVSGLTAQKSGINVTKVAVDSAGEVAMLNGPYAYSYIIGNLFVGGSGITPNGSTQYDLDSQGRLYALTNGVLTVTNTSNPTAQTLATGVTQFAIDSAGEIAMLKGSTEYDYIVGGLEIGGGVVTNGGTVQYALDAAGRLFTLLGGVLTITDTSLGVPRQVASGVTRMAVDSAGEVVILQGSSAYQYFAGLLGSVGTNAGPGPLPQYAVDAQGRFYTLQNGQLTEKATMSGAITRVASNVIQLGTTPLGQVDYEISNGTVEQSTTGSGWTMVGVSGVTATDGSGWFLGVTVVDGQGNRDIYRFSNGQAYQIPGLATQLQVSGGSLVVVTGGGGLNIATSKGAVPIFKNVTGITPGPGNTFVASFGSWLKADVAAAPDASGAVDLTFTNVQINAGPLVDMVKTFVGNLQGMTKPLSQVFTPLTQLPGFSQIMSRAGIKTNITLADLLRDALDATGHSDAAGALQTLGSVVQEIDQPWTFPSGSWVSLPKASFTAAATGGSAIQLGSLPGGDLLQQLGGAYASLASEAAGVGVTLPSEATLLGVLLGGSTNVPLLTYTLPKVSASLPVLNETLATIGTPIPGITLNGKIVGNLTVNVGGEVGLKASALTSGNLGQSLFFQNAVLSAGLSIGPAGELDLGVSGVSLVGYQVAGLFNLQASAVFRPDSIVVVPSVTNSVSCHWVGPNFDPSELGGSTIASVDPDVLILDLQRKAANGLLQQWGLPTIPDPGTIFPGL